MLGVTPGCGIGMLRGTQACGHRIRSSAGVAHGPRARCFIIFVVYGYSFYIAYCVSIVWCGKGDGRGFHGPFSRTHGPPSRRK